MKKLFTLLFTFLFSHAVFAEDGHRLWLPKSENATKATVINKAGKSATVNIACDELSRYWNGQKVTLLKTKGEASDGYLLKRSADGSMTISSTTDVGLLYGAYSLILGWSYDVKPNDSVYDAPKSPVRILNHWDNPNGTVERGFSGRSIFWKPNGVADLNIIKEYARANASVGINATVLNNVNAKPGMLAKDKLMETKRIADVLRPYGIRVFLAVNFASPKALGGLPTADPLDPAVQKWWKDKSKEIYKLIPDFGGFLVKANSEGEPGPMDYDRTHADGANMLADAIMAAYKETHKHPTPNTQHPLVMWRAFVYSPKGTDRASQAYDEFMPFDGQFRDNVIIQVKNGPIDFQPREPVSPLFFGLKKTPVMPEFQITQEYLGESIHAVYLATMWKEFFETIEQTTNTQHPTPNTYKAISAVANVGTDRNWCGSVMAQANWYAFGRLAWDSSLSAYEIARDWMKNTLSGDRQFIDAMMPVMLQSREAAVHYMMPLGLHHIFAGGHHYGPEPWCAPKGWREDWLPRYYHKADGYGIGFDRTDSKVGSGNTRQYPDALYKKYNNIETCPEQLLLWFHHANWMHRMHNGETLWDALCHTYDLGVREAAVFADVWRQMKPYVDAEVWQHQMRYYDRQAKDAWWWRDACLLYFQQFSKMPFPIDCPAPRYKLADLMKYKLDMDNYTTADVDKLP